MNTQSTRLKSASRKDDADKNNKTSSTSTVDTSSVIEKSSDSNIKEQFHLVWLDVHNKQSDDKNSNYLNQLQQIVNHIDILTNVEKSIDLLNKINAEQIFMIISEPLPENIISVIHKMNKLNSIYVFCDNKSQGVDWANKWSKVKGIFTEIKSLCAAMQRSKRQSDQDSIQISIVSINNDSSILDLEQLEPSFMYTQLLKEILMEIDDENDEKPIEELAAYCRNKYASNSFELKNIDKFVKEFHDHTPIWWYTYECFLYPMLNKSLRLLEIDVILKMGFFLRHLHHHIEQLHKEQFGDTKIPFVVYRGQGLSTANFENLHQTKGGLLSFNNFLSTSKDKRVSMNFARTALANPDSMGILYEMTIDPNVSTVPFALLSTVSYYADTEQEILFSMNTVFRIVEIEQIESNDRLWLIKLTLTADDDSQLNALKTQIQKELENVTGWQRLARILIKLGQSSKAEEVYKALIDQSPDEPMNGYFYNQLGYIKYQDGQYQNAISYYEKALEIFQKYLPSDHTHFSTAYNSIGAAYYSMGDYSKAVLFYEKSIEIREKKLSSNHPSLKTSYCNMGVLYTQLGDYPKALSYYKKSLDIEEKILPENHPDLATTLNNVGGVYDSMGDYSQALLFFEKSLNIRKKSLPSYHPDIAESYSNIGSIYLYTGEYTKAFDSYKKALEMRENSLPSKHPDIAVSHTNMGLVFDKMGDYSNAILSHEKALEIRQTSLPQNHPDLATTYNNIGVVYANMGQKLKAIPYFENAIKIGQISLPANHRDLQLFQTSLAAIKGQL